MSNIIANDAVNAQNRCKPDTASNITKGMSVLRDPQLSKVRFLHDNTKHDSARCDAEARIIYRDQICGFYSHYKIQYGFLYSTPTTEYSTCYFVHEGGGYMCTPQVIDTLNYTQNCCLASKKPVYSYLLKLY